MKTVVACITTCFIVLLLFLYGTVDNIDAKLSAALDAFGMFLFAIGLVLIVAMVLLAIVLIYALWNKHRTGMRRPVDGAFPLVMRKMRRWNPDLPWFAAFLEWCSGETLIVNVNTMVASAGVVGPRGFEELTPAAGWDRQVQVRKDVESTNRVRAAWQGDASRSDRNGAMSRMPAMGGAWRAFNARNDKPLGLPDPDTVDGEYSRVEPLQLAGALAQSTPTRWVLGQSKCGKTVAFDPTTQQNIGIVGATGTGKTTASGFHVLILALKFGWHPIILDPKGGTDLRPFAMHGEWRPTSAEKFGEQMALIREEHARRHQILRDHEVANIDELHSAELPHVLVFCEEYGALWEEIEATYKRAEVERINSDIDVMMRMSRMTGIHFCFVDQFPEKWSQQVFMATKMRLVYQVAPGQDSFLREYKADALPDRGAFMYRRQVYQSWHVKPVLRDLLMTTPPSRYDELIDTGVNVPALLSEPVRDGVHETVREGGEGVHPVVAPPADERTNAANGGPKWEEFTRDWLVNNEPSPSALARAMATAEGDIKSYDRYKGIAAQMIAACQQAQPAQPATAREALLAMNVDLSSVRIGDENGPRLGVDRSRSMGQ